MGSGPQTRPSLITRGTLTIIESVQTHAVTAEYAAMTETVAKSQETIARLQYAEPARHRARSVVAIAVTAGVSFVSLLALIAWAMVRAPDTLAASITAASVPLLFIAALIWRYLSK
jgi:hypothetical protein